MSRVARAGKEASSAAGSAYSWLCARLRCVRLGSTPSYSPPHLGKYFVNKYKDYVSPAVPWK